MTSANLSAIEIPGHTLAPRRTDSSYVETLTVDLTVNGRGGVGAHIHWVSVHDEEVGIVLVLDQLAQLPLVLCAQIVQLPDLHQADTASPPTLAWKG